MKNKKAEQKIFSFHSISSPCDFTARIKEEALRSNLKIEQNDIGFNLQLDANHGGTIAYKATGTILHSFLSFCISAAESSFFRARASATFSKYSAFRAKISFALR